MDIPRSWVLEGIAVIPNAACGRALLTSLLTVVITAPASGAQAMLRGRVIDSEFGHGLPGAVVRLRKDSLDLITDSLGRFEKRDLRTGNIEVTIKVIGYAPGVFKVFIPPTGAVE